MHEQGAVDIPLEWSMQWEQAHVTHWATDAKANDMGNYNIWYPK